MPILLSVDLRGAYTIKRPMPYYVAVLYSILWITYIKFNKQKSDNAIYHLLAYLSLSYIDIMRFSPVN